MNVGQAMYDALRRKAPPRIGHQFSREYWRGYDLPNAPLPKWIDAGSAKYAAWRAGRDTKREEVERNARETAEQHERARQHALAAKQREQRT